MLYIVKKVLYKLYNKNNGKGKEDEIAPEEPRAKSQEPRAKSQEPRAKSQKGERRMSAFEMFGNYFKELRLKNRITLREFCSENKLDPGNISKIERGLAPPPKSKEVLLRFAESLGIEKGSEEWTEFFDRAAACTGIIPPDMMSDPNFVAKLPLVFRSLRGQAEITDEQLRKLAEDIRRA